MPVSWSFWYSLDAQNKKRCTYPEACNYDADAVVDNGSCDFATCAGCTDPEALNYDSSATVDDGSCVYDPVPSTAECVTSVDFDSYTYPVVAVGPQCWFAENLRTTVFQDGSPIAEETVANFPNLDSPARTAYNSSSSVINTHGYLYNGIAAATSLNGGICPTGWHVPTELDWMEMESYLVIAGHGKRMGEVLKKSSGWAQGGGGTDLYGWNEVVAVANRAAGRPLRLERHRQRQCPQPQLVRNLLELDHHQQRRRHAPHLELWFQPAAAW